MAIERLNSELLDHLVDEFGKRGRRAVGFLLTAQEFQSSDALAAPRLAESVAYCLREALGEILASVEIPSRPRWEEVSRDVVHASYDQMLWMSDRFEGATYPPF